MRKSRQYTVICLSNEGYEVSLEKRKIYVAFTDDDADTMRISTDSCESLTNPERTICIQPNYSLKWSYHRECIVQSLTQPNPSLQRTA